jgi:hypothetical protein
MMGRQVKILINDQQTAGSSMFAGMYLYTIKAGDFRKTKKMILLK